MSHHHVTAESYAEEYQRSISNPDAFWAEKAEKYLDWIAPWKTVSDCDYNKAQVRWFEGGKLNVCHNCVDRHLAKRGDKVALIWESDNPAEPVRKFTYNQLAEEVAKVANALKSLGVEKGDRVCLYMPMIPEAAFSMLACARIGAIHSVVFGGFSPESLKSRLLDAMPKVVVTADEGRRGGKTVPLKANVDKAVSEEKDLSDIKKLVVAHTGSKIAWNEKQDVDYHELVTAQESTCPISEQDATDPLFILYTSGSTGTPKGVMHGTGGYLLYAHMTTQDVFDLQEDDIYWCTADVGWITGHTYFLYGPLSNGATVLMFEGVPQYPDWSRWWQIIEKHKVTKFYTAPTAIRGIQAHGDDFITSHDLSSLKLLGTVGEPINPEAYKWYKEVVGANRCPIVDTWWQTETGGTMLVPLPYAHNGKPGSACLPYFGVKPVLLDEKYQPVEGAGDGYLCIEQSWPGQMQGVWQAPDRFYKTYFEPTPQHFYFSGDGATRDADGHYWITGRVDDVLNVSGHRLGSAEIESALVLHPSATEAAVVGIPHKLTGEGIYAFVSLHVGEEGDEALKEELVALVRQEIGPIAKLNAIQFTPDLPKTRSGKIMRRILRKVAKGDIGDLGDTSTLADPAVVTHLVENRIPC